MLTFSGEQLKNYISDMKQKAIKQTGLSEVYERDFVDDIRKFCFGGKSPFVFIICGLSLTGKTFGILQAVENPDDTIYIQAQLCEDMNGQDYIEFLKNVKEKNIIIDEYSRIKDSHDLSCYLSALAENGKRIVITGKHTLSLDYLEDVELVYRTNRMNVNLFSYEEFCRIYQKPYCKDTFAEFLKTGGLFKFREISSPAMYIKEAVIDDLSRLTNCPAEELKAIVYTIMYLSVCGLNVTNETYLQLQKLDEKYRNALTAFGVNPETYIHPVEFNKVAKILEKADIIVRTYSMRREEEFRFHLVNPSLAYHTACAVYGEKSEDEKLAMAFEAYMFSYMTSCVRETDCIWYIELGRQEIELVIVNPDEHLTYLFDLKLHETAALSENSSLLSKELENAVGCLEVGGRFVTGNFPKDKCEIINHKRVIFSKPDSEALQYYREFNRTYHQLRRRKV